MRSVRSELCTSVRDAFVIKSTGVTSGWMLNAAITVSVLAAVRSVMRSAGASEDLAGDSSLFESIGTLSLTLFIFSIVIVVASLLAREVVKRQQIPQRSRTVFSNGLGFLPAWQWKNVISTLITICMGGVATDKSPYFVAIVVLTIGFLSAAVQMLLESQLSNAEEDSLTYQVCDKLRTSLGLGMGFAVNLFFTVLLGSHMKELWVRIVYGVSVTLCVALVQVNGKPHIESKKDEWSPLLYRSMIFFLIASNFVVGWAWKGMIDAIFAGFVGTGLLWKLSEVIIISCTMKLIVLVFAVTGIASQASRIFTPRHGGAPATQTGIEALVVLAAGMNVGWAWAGFAMACQKHYVDEYNSGAALGIGAIWLFTLMFIILASGVALFLEMVIQRLEVRDEEDEELVK